MKLNKKRNPIAYELRCSRKYAMRIVKNKKIYSRKTKHKKSSIKKYMELSFMPVFFSVSLKSCAVREDI